MRVSWKVVLAWPVIAGCLSLGLDRNNYIERYAGAQCRMQQRCSASGFHEYWTDMEDCTRSVVDDWDPLSYADCEFDRDDAQRCLANIQHASSTCDPLEFYRAYTDCSDVWVCDGYVNVGGGGGYAYRIR